MLKPAALLLLLAVMSSRPAPSLSDIVLNVNHTTCPLTFYGRSYTEMQVKAKDSQVEVCFKDGGNVTHDCFRTFLPGLNVTSVKDSLTKVERPAASVSPTTLRPNSTSPCHVTLTLSASPSSVFVVCLFFNFGKQTALRCLFVNYPKENITFTAAAGGMNALDEWTFTRTEITLGIRINLSGCRDSGVIYKDGTSLLGCPTATCLYGVFKTVSCDVCTVTGSTAIDFSGRALSIKDRCVYTLMRGPIGNSSSFELYASFKERRRQDVTFFDHLVLVLSKPPVQIYLLQGARVQVGDRVLTLGSTNETVHGLEFSKDQTGVTAKFPEANTTIFFDGDTAHVIGLYEAVDGLCGNTSASNQSTTPAAQKATKYSSASCGVQYKDTTNISIDCSHMTKQCGLLMQAPFTACHQHINPAAYVSACKSTLCSYPNVDDLLCQRLEAYAEACRLKSNITLGEWRSKANCSAVPQAFCQDRQCAAHEFCKETVEGKRCACRAIVDSKYESNNSFGDPTVCSNNAASISLALCRLEDKRFDYKTFHLKDSSCKGSMNNRTRMVTFRFDSTNLCGAEVQTSNATQILYKNTIMTSNVTDIITRQDELRIDFSCLYKQPTVETMSFKLIDGSVVQQIVSGVWSYTLMMNAYADPSFTKPILTNGSVELNQRIWVELKTLKLDANMVAVVTDSCWATSKPSPNDTVRYDLIKNGCASLADRTVMVQGNGLGTSNSFSFKVFKFVGEKAELYLHCQLELCAKQGGSCAPTCGVSARRRRSIKSRLPGGHRAVITMGWTN